LTGEIDDKDTLESAIDEVVMKRFKRLGVTWVVVLTAVVGTIIGAPFLRNDAHRQAELAHRDPHSATNGHDGHSTHPESHSIDQAEYRLVLEETRRDGAAHVLTMSVADARGTPVTEFEEVHEKLLHLIVVRDDLGVFLHEHPRSIGEGKFSVRVELPKGGNYTLFADHKPVGHAQRVATGRLSSQLPTGATDEVNFDRRQSIGNTLVSLRSHRVVSYREGSSLLTFTLTDRSSGEAVRDLKPYLGAMGHLVVVRRDASLSRASYVHAHPMPSSEEGAVSFNVPLTRPGLYRAWGQFNRGGTIVTASFWFEAR
jgi:hypothetical protein